VYQRSDPLTRSSTFLKALYRDHREKSYDIIQSFWGLPFGLYSVLFGKNFHIPSVVSLLGGETASLPHIHYGAMTRQPQRAMVRWICRNADVVTVGSRKADEELRQWGIERNDVPVIPLGANDKFFTRDKKPFPKSPFRFLSIGDINPVKDPLTLLAAFKAITCEIDAHLRIIGADHMNGLVQQKIKELEIQDRVEILGFLPHRAIPSHLIWADVLLHTSQHEGGGAVISESAAGEVVVCGTAVGLISDLSPERALSVNVGDSSGLAQSVLSLLSNEGRFLEMRRKAKQWASEHRSARVAVQFERLYVSLLPKQRLEYAPSHSKNISVGLQQ
jgi:glycosyltransferase involved in cell wall biosynthesis